MRYDFEVRTELPDTYRTNRVRSLFNTTPEQAGVHRVSVELPLDEQPWSIGAILGPSGTGKTILARRLLPGAAYFEGHAWGGRAIVDEIDSGGDLDRVTAALSSVGLGTVPSWLRPYSVLSGGERFRADLARVLVEPSGDVVFDEFTSVVDRQVACVGAAAFAKGWRRTGGRRFVAVGCHYDVVDWLQPDWLLDTSDWSFHWRTVQRPPAVSFDVLRTSWAAWRFFEPHHYLKAGQLPDGDFYIAQNGETPLAFLGATPTQQHKGIRLSRLVVMPEWQGAGVGMRFLEYVAERYLGGQSRFGRPMSPVIHTSHPGLIAALARRPTWRATSRNIGAGMRSTGPWWIKGHLRAVAGFRYVGGA